MFISFVIIIFLLSCKKRISRCYVIYLLMCNFIKLFSKNEECIIHKQGHYKVIYITFFFYSFFFTDTVLHIWLCSFIIPFKILLIIHETMFIA